MLQIKGPVLAAVGFDESLDEVIRQADALARFYKVGFCACHILAEASAVRPLFPYLHLDDAMKVADLEASIHKALVKTIHSVTARSEAQMSVMIEQGTVHSGILRAAERLGAGMIVVGTTRKSGMHLSSSIAELVTRHADCSVLLVRPSRGGKVLAATDFSDPSLPAIAAGASEATRLRTELAIIHAIDVLPMLMPTTEGFTSYVLPAEIHSNIRQASQQQLDDCVRRFGAEGGGLLSEGPAADCILAEAEKLPAQLIVVGTHGRTGLKRMAMGSVAETVLRASQCSTLVVRIS